LRQPEAFRAVTRFSPPPPAGGAPSQRGPGNYERSRRHAQALPQAARGYRLLPLCSPHGAARAPAPPCAGAAHCGPGGAGPGRRAAGAADGFPRRAAGRPRGGAHRPGGHGPARPHPCDRAAAGRDAGRPGRHPARRRKRPRHARDRSSPCRSRRRNSAPVPGTLREKPRPHRVAAHRRDGHRPARRADARRQRILPAPRL